ncbi:hypothetical protein G6L37_04335 [Agrobacterium rubi]|nr:hypothetical protein [Agrobacterium rubi]NTF24580.1 hypothetical protein [Agrobacterium rubi]
MISPAAQQPLLVRRISHSGRFLTFVPPKYLVSDRSQSMQAGFEGVLVNIVKNLDEI